jgi:CHAT domain-containing protein
MEDPAVAQNLNNLALLYRTRGQTALAEPLYPRALAIAEKSYGPEHANVASILNNLAVVNEELGHPAQAESLFECALKIQEKTLGPDHADVASSLNNLAGQYSRRDDLVKAEASFKRSLAIAERTLGPDHPDVAKIRMGLASVYIRKPGGFPLAETLLNSSLAIYEKSLGPNHPLVASTLNELAKLYVGNTKFGPAIGAARRASAIYRQRMTADGASETAVREAAQNMNGFAFHLTLLSLNLDREPAASITSEGFEIVQLAQASGTASAVAKMAARFAGGDDALATLIKRKQDASQRIATQEGLLLAAASKPALQRVAVEEQRLRDSAATSAQEITRIDAELVQRFPQYQELTRQQPMSVAQARALLKPDEAMVVYNVNTGTNAWVVTPSSATFVALKFIASDLAAKVATIRSEMEFDSSGRARRVSVGVLHDLYKGLFAPIEPHLAGVRHIVLVPSGALQSLPFGMLVASEPPQINTDDDYRAVDWLAKRYAISVLPSVSSIQAFRRFAKAGQAQQPFAGFGDPLIGSELPGGLRGKRAKIDVAGVFRSLIVDKSAVVAMNVEIADVNFIRAAPRLPETADELKAMALVLKADNKSLWLQGKATETNVKTLDLSNVRTIAFATHGVMSGEVKGVGEPGLVLTPPRVGTVEDDGYLSSSEIAKLNLNADWVVLSACNTAAADGTAGAEGLSGLAKAFFYAGARSLLVSHWPVASDATVPLTTTMLKEYETNPKLGKAQAQRKAMLDLMNTPGHPEYAHPLFWAPFVVVGEGG